MDTFQLSGWFADFESHEFYYGLMAVSQGKILEIREAGDKRLTWQDRDRLHPIILPGLVDAHVHIESSMLMPSRFAEAAVRFGTVATVSDPHEIANVLGLEGINLMLKDAEKSCIRIHFTAPSCVPATSLETAGAILRAADLEGLFSGNRVVALGEMMNYPGVLGGDKEVIEKIALAKRFGKPVDGHAPGLSGEGLDAYIGSGIDTDHECSTLEEAKEKISKGMKVLIREGSSARNFDQLFSLIDEFPEQVMLCTDDYHPDDLLTGHIDRLIRRGLKAGLDFFNLYRAASLNPVEHYRLENGMLRCGDRADFIIAGGLDPFIVEETWINGMPVFRDGTVLIVLPAVESLNSFHARPVKPEKLAVRGTSGTYRVIRAVDGELITGSDVADLVENDGVILPDVPNDVLKIVVLNRYAQKEPAIGWISGFGLKSGALASSIAHDSHNIIAVGTSDDDIAAAMNLVISNKGGIAVTGPGIEQILPLPVAGLMSALDARQTGTRYAELTGQAIRLGSSLKAPFMALSFMALLVIPHLKIGDLGLFDCDTFSFVSLKAD